MVAPPISITWPRLSPAVSDCERRDGRIQIDARFQSNGQTGHGIRCVVRAQQLERELALALAGAIAHMQAGQVLGRFKNLRIGAGTGAKVNRAAVKSRGQTARRRDRRS